MNLTALIPDVYVRKARLYPALLLIAPIAITTSAIMADSGLSLRPVIGILATFGGAFFLSQLARDFGKRKEKELFESWDGIPSVTIFRYRDNRLDSITKARYQKRLAKLVPGTKEQSVSTEQLNPIVADQNYSSWSNYLRSNTRNTKKFSLLFQENINYGYRRNVWGLRATGIWSCLFCTLLTTLDIYQIQISTGEIDRNITGAFLFSFFFLFLWVFHFNREWVRIPAFAYAERLIEAIEIL